MVSGSGLTKTAPCSPSMMKVIAALHGSRDLFHPDDGGQFQRAGDDRRMGSGPADFGDEPLDLIQRQEGGIGRGQFGGDNNAILFDFGDLRSVPREEMENLVGARLSGQLLFPACKHCWPGTAG